MKFILSLSWKNLSRHKRRTAITTSAIAFGLMLYIIIDSLLAGIELDSERNLIWYETAYAKIMNTKYWEERDQMPLKYVIEDPEKIIAAVEYPAVPRAVFGGEVIVNRDPYPEDGSMQVKVIALDPERDEEVFRISETVVDGRYLEGDEDGVVLGAWLANDLGAEVGYPVTIVTRTRNGYFQTIDLDIVGIINCPNPVLNKGTVLMTLGAADYYMQMEGAVTEIALEFPARADARTLADEVESELKGLNGDMSVLEWQELAKDYLAIAEMKTQGSSIILFLVFIIAAVGISNTMLMAVYERIRELGMMRALGMKDSEVRTSFMLESGGIGFLGALSGLILGALCNWPLVQWGIDFGPLIGDMDIGYRVADIMRGTWKPVSFIVAFVVGIVASMIIAYIPTKKALKMEVTECLRYE
jgi:ABC-type lipoprotein release transport system permease subunit